MTQQLYSSIIQVMESKTKHLIKVFAKTLTLVIYFLSLRKIQIKHE